MANSVITATLRRLMHHPFGLPAPAWLLRFGARLIGTETELVLKSRWVIPTKLMEAGFVFHYKTIEAALQDILETSNKTGR